MSRFFQYFRLIKETDGGKCFSFNGKTIFAKCVSVYDGDTITVKFFHNNDCIMYKIRLLGLDTPELKTKNDEEKKLSTKVKEIVSNMVLNKVIKMECKEFDKYGRILGNIYVKTKDGEIFLNDFLIKNKLAIPYDGTKKEKFNPSNFDIKNFTIETQNYSIFSYLFKRLN